MIRRELMVFLIVGVLTVCVDFASYRVLVWAQLLNIDLAKAAGFIFGTIFAYFANKLWTFGHIEHECGSIYRFVALYAITLGLNVVINKVSLNLLADFVSSVEMAFILATAVSAGVNFLGMKFFVFRQANRALETL